MPNRKTSGEISCSAEKDFSTYWPTPSSCANAKAFNCTQSPSHCLSHLLPPEKHHLGLRPRGHSYALPICPNNLSKRSFIPPEKQTQSPLTRGSAFRWDPAGGSVPEPHYRFALRAYHVPPKL